jgi:cystathionine beta-lyase/cystathionine gamma-synthase
MNILNASLISLTAAALAGAATAKEAATPDAGASAATAAAAVIVSPDDKVVCRSQRYTGTRMAVRVCETVAERKRRIEDERTRQQKDDTRGGGMNRINDMDPGRR